MYLCYLHCEHWGTGYTEGSCPCHLSVTSMAQLLNIIFVYRYLLHIVHNQARRPLHKSLDVPFFMLDKYILYILLIVKSGIKTNIFSPPSPTSPHRIYPKTAIFIISYNIELHTYLYYPYII